MKLMARCARSAWWRALGIATVLAIALAACISPDDAANQSNETRFEPGAFETVVVSSPGSIAVGPQRLIVLLKNGPIRVGAPDQIAELELKRLGADAVTVAATWVWGDESAETGGAWIVNTDLDQPGVWRATLTVDGRVGTATTFDVAPNTTMPRTGDAAPRTTSATTAESPLTSLTTDADPDERLYQTSIAEAVASGRPSAIVFSTPEFCTTDVCGPLLDAVKDRIDDHPDVKFIHVEVYEDINDNDGELVPRPSVFEWGIETEPWVFFVNADGVVTSSFEGVMSSAELDAGLVDLSTGA